ncbi:unnamed protein product, partial [Amoebophrya sp. A25]|eukprot:GSA25T00013069001.1
MLTLSLLCCGGLVVLARGENDVEREQASPGARFRGYLRGKPATEPMESEHSTRNAAGTSHNLRGSKRIRTASSWIQPDGEAVEAQEQAADPPKTTPTGSKSSAAAPKAGDGGKAETAEAPASASDAAGSTDRRGGSSRSKETGTTSLTAQAAKGEVQPERSSLLSQWNPRSWKIWKYLSRPSWKWWRSGKQTQQKPGDDDKDDNGNDNGEEENDSAEALAEKPGVRRELKWLNGVNGVGVGDGSVSKAGDGSSDGKEKDVGAEAAAA